MDHYIKDDINLGSEYWPILKLKHKLCHVIATNFWRENVLEKSVNYDVLVSFQWQIIGYKKEKALQSDINNMGYISCTPQHDIFDGNRSKKVN